MDWGHVLVIFEIGFCAGVAVTLAMQNRPGQDLLPTLPPEEDEIRRGLREAAAQALLARMLEREEQERRPLRRSPGSNRGPPSA